MAYITLHFAPTARGTGDGSTAANAAILFPSGNISSLLTANNYATQGVLALCQNTGAYTLSQSLTAAVFSGGAPTNLTNALLLHMADSSGNIVKPTNPGWNCAESDMNTTGFCTINYTITTTAFSAVNIRMVGFIFNMTTSVVAFTQPIGKLMWCDFRLTSTATTFVGFTMASTSGGLSNCQISVTGTSYARIYTGSSSGNQLDNIRMKGDTAATTGTRYGFAMSLATAYPIATGRLFVRDVTGVGVINYNTGVSAGLILSQATVVNCGIGVSVAGTTSARLVLSNCVITGCTTGVDQSSGIYVFDNILLRNTTNYGTAAQTFVTDPAAIITTETDNQLYNDSSSGDYRIKPTSAHFGKNRGAGDKPSSLSTGSIAHGIYMGSRGIV